MNGAWTLTPFRGPVILRAHSRSENIDSLGSGDRFLNRIHPEDLPHRMICLSRHLTRGEIFDHEYRIRDDSGQFMWIQERAVATKLPDGKPSRLTGVVRNIDARKKSEEEVNFLSNHDALTGQYNRLRLRESLEHVIAQSLLTGQPGGLAAGGARQAERRVRRLR